MKSIEAQLNEALDLLKCRDAEIVTLKKVIHEKQIIIAKTERDGKLKESGLPAGAVARLHAAFAQSTDNAGLKQAINCERRMPQSKQDARVERILGDAA